MDVARIEKLPDGTIPVLSIPDCCNECKAYLLDEAKPDTGIYMSGRCSFLEKDYYSSAKELKSKRLKRCPLRKYDEYLEKPKYILADIHLGRSYFDWIRDCFPSFQDPYQLSGYNHERMIFKLDHLI